MSENRADRTANLGLLALMQSPGGGGPTSGVQGWGWPYWNQLWLDAVIAALHEATRDGAALLNAPTAGPTVEMSEETGYLAAGLTLEVCQTWVDEWGRETDAGVVTEFGTGEGIPDPGAAPTLGAPTSAATGFDGGLLEVAYCWIDEMAGESLPSPTARVDVPYRTGGLQSEVLVILPATPASVGAAGAFIYARHRSGNWVRAAAISDDTETEITLDGTWISCFVSLPLANSTGAGKALDITGVAAPAAAALTRFYVRNKGEAWADGDHRLRVDGIDEWEPSAIVYPLVFRGALDEIAPGYPPPVSLVKAIRPIDLSTEAIGELPAELLPNAAILGEDLVKSIGSALISGFSVTANAPANMKVAVASGEALNASGWWDLDGIELTIPAAHSALDRIDIICLSDNETIEGPTENAALKGAAGAEPSPPSTPAGYLKLAEIYVTHDDAEIGAPDITDSRILLTTLVEETVARIACDAAIAGDLSSHTGNTLVHSSKAAAFDQVNKGCDGLDTSEFTIACSVDCLITSVKLVCVSAGAIDYDFELFANSARTTLAYKAEGITTASWEDRIPWEWFAASTFYGRITNNSADAISNLAIDVKYRK